MWPKCVLVTQLIEFEFQALIEFPIPKIIQNSISSTPYIFIKWYLLKAFQQYQEHAPISLENFVLILLNFEW
jgi:hypothetical protein